MVDMFRTFPLKEKKMEFHRVSSFRADGGRSLHSTLRSCSFPVDGFLAGSLRLRGDKACSYVAHVYSRILCTIFPKSQAPVVATRA